MTAKVQQRGRQGKVPREFLESVVFANLGAKRSSLLVKPGHGLDNAVISLGGKKVLLVTSDPLSVIPSIGMKRSAWLSVHLLASDLTTSGVSPQFAMLDLNLPPEMGLRAVGAYLKAVGDECRKLGIAIAGGHTGRYPGSGYTVVGGGTMFSVAEKDAYVTPAMARPGDLVLITKGAAIGATAVLAHSFPETVEAKEGATLLGRARSRLRDCSTVREAQAAAAVGLREKVTSMHDATEGGVLGGLFELSSACGLPVIVRREAIHVPEEVAGVCGVFGLDPLTTLSEGTLIITCTPGAVESLRAALVKAQVESYEIGCVGQRSQGSGLWLSSGGEKPVAHTPELDGYWEAYSGAVGRGQK
ncbi:MAG TPA: AIR synthase family protein [Nitrososphaerales archaeon]|nr:AIR synthase family protein [Nitrososphaerales archaeon]